ncbi:MAG TPA: transglycosylase SLT domain-containing protein [Terriglobales bacterium]|nr:transglycosylase SLT domain-containing protein [Terriglobales bacterium]
MRRIAVAVFAGFFSLLWLSVAPSLAVAHPQSSTTTESAPAQKTATSAAEKKAPAKPAASNATSARKKAASSTSRNKRKPASPRVRRVRRAFVASTSLRPMAQQLLQDRTPTAYAGVEAYARHHPKEDAGALAWLVIGYAHTLDHDYAKAMDPLNRAKAGASELGDYVAYYLGDAYLKTTHNAEALATLADFSKNFPDSLLIRDADLVYANALLEERRAQEAASLLEKDRAPLRSDLELAIGRAYEAAGDNQKAAAAFRNLYFNMPNSFEADMAGAELRKLGVSGSVAERRTRADLLLKAKHYDLAAHDFRDLVQEVTPADRPEVQLALAAALEKSGGNDSKEAHHILIAMGVQQGDAEAERLYLLSETERSASDEDAVQRRLTELRLYGPTSPWLEQALLSAGNMYLLKRDYDHAIDYFRELQERFPKGTRASYAHWKAAWLAFRQGRTNEARKGFEDQIALYPDSNEVPNALYWRARLAEEEGNLAMARAFYQKLSDRYRNYYYAEFGRQRLKALSGAAETAAESAPKEDPPHFALLDRVGSLSTAGKITATDPPEDNLRVERARLLSNGGLADAAVRELQAAASQEDGTWAPPEMARVYQDGGRYDRGIEIMKRTTPNYFAIDLPDLPRPYWEALFPKGYWTDLRKYSVLNGLDPYMVASLIRQESEFNAQALSHANAVGLMQLLPRVGKTVAKQVKLKGYSAPQLFTPAVNLELGTRYFKEMVDKYNGQFEYALAAYNAGTDRVGDWLGQGHYRDPQEFVESIPFTETREYVQAILRNANVYRQLYGTP